MFEPNRSRTSPTERFAVVLSDVHIGNGAPTCWYQSSVHERQLTEVLSWVLARRAVIREVVLLGDLFDVWTYPPHVRPPSMGDIIAANRRLLGPSGPLSAVVRALPGRVRLLLGNHDGSITRADIDALNRSLGGNQSRGERIELVDAPWRVVTGASGARTVFSHGHRWCMFNAPDTRSRWGTIPIGHIASRAIAYDLARKLRSGETAAHRPNSGNPRGIDARALMDSWRRRPGDLAALFIDYFCGATGMPKTQPIVMPGGATTTAQEAARVFAGLYTLWVRREGRERDALRAAAAEYPGGADLAWFAQRLAMRTASDLAVLGHTHTPVGGLEVSPVDYVNSGYMCVSGPDAAAGTELTFTQVDLERATAQVLAVVPAAGGFGIVPARTAHPMPSAILHGAQDYSCYVRLENRSDRPLRLVRSGKSSASYWVIKPPGRIAPHARVDMWVQDPPLTEGSQGSFAYADGGRTLDFAFRCPRLSSNAVTSSVPGYQTKVGRGAWRTDSVEGRGYPLQVRFFVGAPGRAGVGPASAPAAPPRRRAPVQESPYVVAARAVLDAHRSPSYRGAVMCVAHLTSNDGGTLLDPETEPSRTRPGGRQLKRPPNHLLGPDIESITVGGTRYDFVWIQPNLAPETPPNAGGMAFLPARGAATFTLVTFNVAALLDRRRGCRNDHHAEMQVVGFVNAQDARFKLRLGRIQLLNRSRRGPGWGWSACNPCLVELAAFLRTLNTPSRRDTVRASISWERLYVKGPPRCGHETDARNIQGLIDAGWDPPQGDRPPGSTFTTRPPAAPAPRPAPARVYTA